jgi:methylthioribose-1-phosphate isomerase
LPSTTIDWTIDDGVRDIPIEERDAAEVTHSYGLTETGARTVRTVASGTPVSNYAFDVTPARLVTGLITERGVCATSEAGLAGLFPQEASR